jgi:gamma-glutamylaminecyclotransferase
MRNSPSPADQTPLVFVYGTLKRGLHNHHVMARARGEFLGEAHTLTEYPLVADGLPYLLDQPGTGQIVQGEVFRVWESDGWELLDRLESHPSFYRRRVERVAVDRGGHVMAWIYFLATVHPRLAERPHLASYP